MIVAMNLDQNGGWLVLAVNVPSGMMRIFSVVLINGGAVLEDQFLSLLRTRSEVKGNTPSGHKVPKWRRIDFDATLSRRFRCDVITSHRR